MKGLSLVWAQAPAGPGTGATALLALRRWCSSQTLSSPEAFPRPFGLWTWLGGLAALLVLVCVVQGPFRALRQVVDVPGHARLLAASLRRLRRAGRLVAVVCGVTVLAWTANQTASYADPQGLADLEALRQSKGRGEVALEQGELAALTPLRDLFGLADDLLLLIVAAAWVFRLSADRWGGVMAPPTSVTTGGASPGWMTLTWGGAWLYVLYRLASLVDGGDLPLGGCLFVEPGVVPLLMVVADGLLIAWVLVELRNAGLGAGGEPLDSAGVLALVPASALAGLAVLPARAAATGALLAFLHVPRFANGVPLPVYKRLAWGLVGLQGLALVTAGLAGAVPWTRGGWGQAVVGYVRMLRAEGGRLVAALALSGLAAGGASALAYLLALALPGQPWVLGAADGYAHYATLPIGLVLLSALVELGERSLPMARRAAPDAAVAEAAVRGPEPRAAVPR